MTLTTNMTNTIYIDIWRIIFKYLDPPSQVMFIMSCKQLSVLRRETKPWMHTTTMMARYGYIKLFLNYHKTMETEFGCVISEACGKKINPKFLTYIIQNRKEFTMYGTSWQILTMIYESLITR